MLDRSNFFLIDQIPLNRTYYLPKLYQMCTCQCLFNVLPLKKIIFAFTPIYQRNVTHPESTTTFNEILLSELLPLLV